MKDFAGTPGTLTALCLRIMQCFFAAMTIACLATTRNFFEFTAFWRILSGRKLLCDSTNLCYLIASMGLQVVWSFGLALLDAYALIKKKVLLNPVLLSFFVIGDWVTATLSLAAASASAGITVLFFNDFRHCHFGRECERFQLSVALAFFSWITISISSLIMLWLLAAACQLYLPHDQLIVLIR